MIDKIPPALKISFIYCLLSFIWILTSDKIIFLSTDNPEILTFLQTIKGWLFITITSIFLYFLIKKYINEERILRERIENIFNNTGIPIVVFSEDGKSLQINKAWRDLSGYSLDEIDNYEKWSKRAYRENAQAYSKILKKHMNIDKRVNLGNFEIKTKDNRTLIWHTTLAPFGYIKGKKFFISTALDITELTEKNKLLIQQSKMATMGEMIGNIAHQWKQPLSVIRTSNSLIKFNKECGDFEESIDRAILDIDNSVQNLSNTIDDFKNFFDPNKFVNYFNIKDIFNKTFKLINTQFICHDIEIVKNIHDIKVYGLENELLQVLINIIKNAKEELLKSKLCDKKLLFVDAKQIDNTLEIRIKDNGNGIDKNIINKIFDSYFSTKRNEGGTGIGLYMSKQIIEHNMKGSIVALNEKYIYENKEYFGAVFIITIPLHYSNS